MHASELRVMTANVGAGIALDRRIIRAIHREHPDIIAMQELTAAQGSRLRDALVADYPHAMMSGDSNEGRGIFSKHPIIRERIVHLAKDRPDIVAVIDVDGVSLTVVVGHPRPQRVTSRGLAFSLASLRQMIHLGRLAIDEGNTILVGDLNMTPRHPSYLRIAHLGMVDAFAHAGKGRGLTFPVSLGKSTNNLPVPPVVRFDYIWVTPDVRVRSCHVGAMTGSDHLPVVADITLGPVD